MLPGIKELFEQAAKLSTKVKPEELRFRVDADYFGLRDEDDGLLLQYERALVQRLAQQRLEGHVDEDEQAALEVHVDEDAAFDEPPTQAEVEDWILSRRKRDLEERYLRLNT